MEQPKTVRVNINFGDQFNDSNIKNVKNLIATLMHLGARIGVMVTVTADVTPKNCAAVKSHLILAKNGDFSAPPIQAPKLIGGPSARNVLEAVCTFPETGEITRIAIGLALANAGCVVSEPTISRVMTNLTALGVVEIIRARPAIYAFKRDGQRRLIEFLASI